MQRGKLVILLIFAVAILLSGYAWWHHYRSNRRSLELWGREGMLLIREAPQVAYLELEPVVPAPQGEQTQQSQLIIRGKAYRVAEPIEITGASGLVHARHTLISDASFTWNGPPAGCEPEWEYALRFRQGSQTMTIAVDTACGAVWWVEGERQQVLIPKFATAFRKKGKDWGGGADKRGDLFRR